MLDRHEETEHFANYSEYSKTLRAWLVAYGIGGPVLVATNKDLFDLLRASGFHTQIVVFFFLGVAVQICLGFINKWCAYNMYLGAAQPSRKRRRSYRFWNWLNGKSWIDFLLDLGSLACFLVATVLFVSAVLAAA